MGPRRPGSRDRVRIANQQLQSDILRAHQSWERANRVSPRSRPGRLDGGRFEDRLRGLNRLGLSARQTDTYCHPQRGGRELRAGHRSLLSVSDEDRAPLVTKKLVIPMAKVPRPTVIPGVLSNKLRVGRRSTKANSGGPVDHLVNPWRLVACHLAEAGSEPVLRNVYALTGVDICFQRGRFCNRRRRLVERFCRRQRRIVGRVAYFTRLGDCFPNCQNLMFATKRFQPGGYFGACWARAMRSKNLPIRLPFHENLIVF